MHEAMAISAKDVDFFSPAFKEQSYQIYKQLRMAQALLPFELSSGLKAWLITRHEDADQLFKNSEVIKDYSKVDPEAGYVLENGAFLDKNMLSSDPPDHTRVRKLVAKAFTPKMIAQLETDIQAITDELLLPIKENGQFEVVRDLALPLPTAVICNMLGIPEEARGKFHQWSQIIVQSANDKNKMVENETSINAFVGYIHQLIESKRKHPDEKLVTLLINAHEEGDSLSEEELISNIFLLIVAGHETTVNLITNGLFALLQNPEQLSKLKDDPGLVDNAIEEMLRYYSPVEIAPLRYAANDLEISGEKISKGDALFISLASVNRDETLYDDPERFDISREKIRHFAFGKGIHFCLGAPLARLEAKVAFTTLLKTFDHLSIDIPKSEIKWRPGMMMRGLESLPVKIK